MAVNKENVRKWVEALRSGKYTQATGYLALTNEDGGRSYCCLGVACEISGLGEWQNDPYSNTYTLPGRQRSNDVTLPPAVQRWLGVREEDGIGKAFVDIHNESHSLTSLNDNLHFSFDQIADVIEEKLLK